MKYNLTTLKIYFKQGRKFEFLRQTGLKYSKIVFKYWKYILNTLKSVITPFLLLLTCQTARKKVLEFSVSKMAKIDPVSPFYPTLWLEKGILQWRNLQEVQKNEPWAVNIYFCAFRNWKCWHNYRRPVMKIPTEFTFNNPSQFPGMF